VILAARAVSGNGAIWIGLERSVSKPRRTQIWRVQASDGRIRLHAEGPNANDVIALGDDMLIRRISRWR
jgi:hypothetical protein